MIENTLRNFARELPDFVQDRIRSIQRMFASPPVGRVNMGELNRITPISHEFGYDRGIPVDRYYIEQFLQGQSSHIQGTVLEIGERTYTQRYGGDRVTASHILFPDDSQPEATVIADLTQTDHLPPEQYDCIICTQTLHVIYDFRAAIASLYRLLKPGGMLLTTVPGISPQVYPEGHRWGDYWRFTRLSFERTLSEYFKLDNLDVKSYGNVLVATSFLYGLAIDDLTQAQLEFHDQAFEVIISAVAQK